MLSNRSGVTDEIANNLESSIICLRVGRTEAMRDLNIRDGQENAGSIPDEHFEPWLLMWSLYLRSERE